MTMGLLVGGWFASTVISKLINELIEYANDQRKKLGLEEELARLEKALPKIQVVLSAADQGLIGDENPPLEKWLLQLRDAANRADDVMDDIKYNYEFEAQRKKIDKVKTNFKTFLFLRDPFLKKLKEAVKEIDEFATHVGDFYMLVQDMVKEQKEMVKLAISSRETSSVLNVRTHVFGRDKDKEDIIMKLLYPDCKKEGENFTVLPIIGLGGVGKTTLVQLVYNDPSIKEHFELRMWVCISNNFNDILLSKKLYESAFEQRADFNSFDVIQKKLKEKLQGKKFLVVFDDAWNDNNKQGWEKLVAPLKDGKSGSMILLTTRLKEVAKLIGPNVMDPIILKGLDKYAMWNLFEECAFGGENPNYHPELVEIGRDIVKKLDRSPLAAKTVGGILCSDLHAAHWTSILQSELWSLKQGQNDIMPALRLTYQYLPPHLKSCFSFCSIFPKYHVFNKGDLINMWIALGMVPRSVNGTMISEDIGSRYFDDLLSKSIFMCPIHEFNAENKFVMHDLIHDISILVSQGECLRTSTNKLMSIPNTVRHLYAHIDDPGELSLSGLKNLRTLILNFHGSHQSKQHLLVTKMLKDMESLRVLILMGNNMSQFPENVNELLHLRYLSITSSRINAFPKSVSNLYLLETMDLPKSTGCDDFGSRQLKQADSLDMLINLRHLIAPKLLLNRISGIGRFTSLQKLSFSVGKHSGFEISQLRDMRELRSLSIDRIENVGSEDVIRANLSNKVNLNKLSLTWTPIKPDKRANEYVLDHLQPHCGLKKLTIRSYKGTGRPPIWFITQALSKLVCLKIHRCNFVHLPCLKQLALLRYIEFHDMDAIKGIIHQCNGSSAIDAFPSMMQECFLPSTLQNLSISSCGQLDTALPKALENVNSLIELELSDCANITSLPPKEVFRRWKTLKNLTLENTKKMASLESLFGLSSIEYLKVCGCPELSPSDIPSPLPLKEDYTKMKCKKWFLVCARSALTFFQSLCSGMVMPKLTRSVSDQPQPPSPSSTMEATKTSIQEKHLLSVAVLVIDDPLLLSVDPIRSLSAVRKLTILDCSKLQSLPELPPFLEELYLRRCSCELWRIIEGDNAGYQVRCLDDAETPYDSLV